LSNNHPHGPTNPIPILDGIPQGETMFSLWWIIFYDPLLTKLSKYKKKPLNLINNLAFMDDLNILSTNQTNTQNLLDITTQFLSLNNISIHPQKTELIIINPKNKNYQLTINNTQPTNTLIPPLIIKLNPKNQPTRILGIYLSEQSIILPGRIKIKDDITTINKALKSKFTTGPMASYIYNKVLLPHIEY
jgi:hypothetical protein